MKKTIVLGALALIALASCKKDYTHTCTTTNGSSSASASTTITDTKKDAEAACNEGDATFGSASTDCEIQ